MLQGLHPQLILMLRHHCHRPLGRRLSRWLLPLRLKLLDLSLEVLDHQCLLNFGKLPYVV